MTADLRAKSLHRRLGALLSGGSCDELTSDELDEFSDWAARHRLASLLYDLLSPEGQLRPRLVTQRQLDAGDYLARRAWLEPLLKAAHERDLKIGVFKGLGIAHVEPAYRVPELRPLGDVDLLIEPAEVDAWVELGAEHGFRPVSADPQVARFFRESHYQVPLVHPRYGLLELHHRLYRQFSSATLAQMRGRANRLEVFGVPTRVLAPTDLWLVLAVHLAHAPQALWVWAADLYRVGLLLHPDDWEQLGRQALDSNAALCVASVLALFEYLWQAPLCEARDVHLRLQSSLGRVERRALRRVLARCAMDQGFGDIVQFADAWSARELGRLTSMFVPHPGAIVLNTGVSSTDPAFWWHRLRYTSSRIGRAARSVGGMLGW